MRHEADLIIGCRDLHFVPARATAIDGEGREAAYAMRSDGMVWLRGWISVA